MPRFRSSSIAVEQGTSLLFSDYADDGPMWSGNGPRDCAQAVTFAEPFLAPPLVHVAISMWDTDGGTNQRADLRAEKVTRTGFTLVFRTWGDSRVARIRADWMAIGSLADEDAWEVD